MTPSGGQSRPLRVLSLGAGVQSTTLALMAAQGEIDKPEAAIFADTGWEPSAVYEHLVKLEAALTFPVYRVQTGDLKADILSGQFTAVPFHYWNHDHAAMGRRQCTYQYKLRPLYRKLRELGAHRKTPCELWLGISLDELYRIRLSRVQYIRNTYPLVDRRMSRWDCIRWLERAGWKAPRSACLGCPYRSNDEWRVVRDGPHDEWVETVAIDRALRLNGKQEFMHRSRLPLDQVDLSPNVDPRQADLFSNECEGICGV